MNLENLKVAVIGLGYVGLPLAVCFAKKYDVIGFDVNQQRVADLKACLDVTNEVSAEQLAAASGLSYSYEAASIAEASVIIVTVPTPVDDDKRPNLKPMKSACRSVGEYLKRGDIVIFESTVFPGCTEEVCVPILEEVSSLSFNQDFYVGYSPERINPGDASRRIENIVKVTSGCTPEVAEFIDQLYASVITAGTFKAGSIKVAEAAKVIENTQRDLNIALINELAMIFNRMGIDTQDVLDAANTKWNFLPFKPGLVGGHCIGVDPYYLTHKAERLGYRPEVILAGRRINDNMTHYVASRIVKLMVQKHIDVAGSKVLVLGVTFKENCPDIRNSKVFDLIHELQDYGISVDSYDPVTDEASVLKEYNLSLTKSLASGAYDAVVFAVAHQTIIDMTSSVPSLLKPTNVIYDLKSVLPEGMADERL